MFIHFNIPFREPTRKNCIRMQSADFQKQYCYPFFEPAPTVSSQYLPLSEDGDTVVGDLLNPKTSCIASQKPCRCQNRVHPAHAPEEVETPSEKKVAQGNPRISLTSLQREYICLERCDFSHLISHLATTNSCAAKIHPP